MHPWFDSKCTKIFPQKTRDFPEFGEGFLFPAPLQTVARNERLMIPRQRNSGDPTLWEAFEVAETNQCGGSQVDGKLLGT